MIPWIISILLLALDWIRVHIPVWVPIAFIAHLTILGTVAYLILLERKIASWVQDRIGPNRVGLDFGLPFLPKFHFWGLGQPLADGLKFIVKEDYRPSGVDKVLFTIAPGIMILVIIISIAVIPWGGIKQTTRDVDLPAGTNVDEAHALAAKKVPLMAKEIGEPVFSGNDGNGDPTTATITYQYPFQIANLNIGVLFVLAVLSLAVYGVVLGGWASNNKYSFLGALRATANMISYEIPMGLAVICIVLMFATLDLGKIVEMQCHYWAGWIPAWNVFTQPLAFMMFLICIHAEANRAPFDLAEAEQELVGGYHTEYSSMRFALFFLAEYAGMITTSAVCVALFFGGWHLPWIEWFWKDQPDALHPAVTTSLLMCILRAVVFFVKTLLVICVFMWVRWSLPRFRFDQLMMLAWRSLIPIALLLMMMTAIVIWGFDGRSFERTADHFGVDGPMAAVMLLVNVIVVAAIMFVSTILPPAPETNRRVPVAGSRFGNAASPSLN